MKTTLFHHTPAPGRCRCSRNTCTLHLGLDPTWTPIGPILFSIGPILAITRYDDVCTCFLGLCNMENAVVTG